MHSAVRLEANHAFGNGKQGVIFALEELSRLQHVDYPLAFIILHNHIYVDDILLVGNDTIIEETIKILSSRYNILILCMSVLIKRGLIVYP